MKKKKDNSVVVDVVKHLKELQETFKARNAVYSDGYNRHAKILQLLFPNGINLEGNKAIRFYFINMIILKLIRFTDNFEKGGHKDSIHDLSVYGCMLDNYIDQEESK